jgi:3-deoxy-D-manno-octulosonic-acid transferase
MSFLYNIGILIFTALVRLAAPFNRRARLWHDGRRNWKTRIAEKIRPDDKTVWVHCASLGEFEQGRPVIEALKKQKPGIKIILTFFSPSGYEVRKNYSEADCISYLPADSPANASEFVRIVNPDLAIFVKYEFWSNYISALYRNKTPLYLISGIFRPGQHFFKWYGGYFRSMLGKFEMFYVQDIDSGKLLNSIGINKVVVAGDTRFDRVADIAAAAKDIPRIEAFRGTERLFLAGSSWAPDEEIMARFINENPSKMKWVFAPHEIHAANIERLQKLFNIKAIRFSEYDGTPTDARVLIIDNIGMLSSAYRYAYIAAVGGGFGKGIHNILEASCWGIPVMFGPRHEKFREAVELIKENGAVSYDSFEKFSETLNKWLDDEAFYLNTANAATSYVKKNTGATDMIMSEIIHRI